MNTLTARFLVSGLLFVLSVVTGIWLRSSGRPFGDLLFTSHKLSAVATVIIIGWSAYRIYKVGDLPGPSILAVAITGTLFLVLAVTGALLTFDKLASQVALRIHQIVPALAMASMAASIYLLSVVDMARQIGAAK
jgi:hypothetical protein